jgi:hypothetical protein
MSKPSAITLGFFVAFAIWILSLGLYWQLSQYDPYSWAFPVTESDLSRSLWLRRRSQYLWLGIVSFVVACTLGFVSILIRRLRDASCVMRVILRWRIQQSLAADGAKACFSSISFWASLNA